MKANVNQAIALFAELGINVTAKNVVFNGDGEITFTCTQDWRDILDTLNAQATSTVKFGYHRFECGPGKLTVEPLGMLGCSVSLRNA